MLFRLALTEQASLRRFELRVAQRSRGTQVRKPREVGNQAVGLRCRFG